MSFKNPYHFREIEFTYFPGDVTIRELSEDWERRPQVMVGMFPQFAHTVLKSCCLRQRQQKKMHFKNRAPVNLWEVHHKDKYFSHAIPFGLFSCVSIASQRLNWKINSNLNYWNKEHQESEIKWLCSLRSFLIGKLFLQGILMVLKEDCKIKLIGWGKVNS